MKSVRVTVPASTSNLGSGFDTLGLAVNLHLVIDASRKEKPGLEMEARSSEAITARKLVEEAAHPWMNQLPGLKVRISGNIPIGRGLGASAALRTGVIMAASSLAGEALHKEQILELAYRLEHHPDNVSPAIHGGFTVSGLLADGLCCQRFEVDPSLKLVVLLPEFEMPTGEARQLLPAHYPRADAAHALNRAALIAATFAKGDYSRLRGMFDDRLHQPYRQRLIPSLPEIIRAGGAAGAIGGFLSGAGSGIICLTMDHEKRVAEAMQRVLPQSRVQILTAENRGAHLS